METSIWRNLVQRYFDSLLEASISLLKSVEPHLFQTPTHPLLKSQSAEPLVELYNEHIYNLVFTTSILGTLVPICTKTDQKNRGERGREDMFVHVEVTNCLYSL
jgi:hypothetical protein